MKNLSTIRMFILVALLMVGVGVVVMINGLVRINNEVALNGERISSLQEEIATLTEGINNIQWMDAAIPPETLTALYLSDFEEITVNGITFKRHSNGVDDGVLITYSEEYLSYGRYPRESGVPALELGKWVAIGGKAPSVFHIIDPAK